MARNDVVLLDSLINKSRDHYNRTDESELFELYVFDQLLKQHEPSFDDLEAGWTDGGNDGGIDGFYICVDDLIATENASEYALRRRPLVTVYIITARRSSKFEQQPIDSLISSLGELLDLTLSEAELKYPYNDEVLEQRRRFREIYVSLADRQPNLQINIIYASRAETSVPAPNVKSRAAALIGTLQNLFSNATVDVRFAGADELLSLSRKGLDLQIRLPLAEPPISREGNRFIILCSLSDYFRAVCDETGALKRYLFDSNVRGYLGNGAVNADIMATLNTQESPDRADFWWLNNGVTVLATNAWVMAKEIIVENAQIVNGLQTTETVYGYFSSGGSLDDKRTIVLKIIVAVDADIRARIVKATNYQSTIDLAQLRGLDKIQRDIDDFLLDNGWFYDRRAHVYKNLGKPADRIISIPYLAAAVRAIALREPARSQRQRSKSLRVDDVYKAVFNEKWDLRVYLVCIEIARVVEQALHARRSSSWWNSPPMALSHFVSFVYVCERLGKFAYEPEEIIQLAGQPPSEEDVLRIKADLSVASRRSFLNERRVKGVLLNSAFMETYIKEKLTAASGTSTTDQTAT